MATDLRRAAASPTPSRGGDDLATPRSTATTAALAAAIGPSAASLKAWRSGAIAGMDALAGEVAATRSALQVLLGGLEADAAGAKAALAARPRGRALARAPPKG